MNDEKLNVEKVIEVMEDELGMTVEEFIQQYALESVVPGICKNCYTIHDSMEPDQCEGWCDECKTKTVISLVEVFI